MRIEDGVATGDGEQAATALASSLTGRTECCGERLQVGKVLLVQRFEDRDVLQVWAAWKEFTPGTVLLSFAYAEKENEDGCFSHPVQLHVGDVSFCSTVPSSARFMMIETRKMLGDVAFWCDRINTIPLLGNARSTAQEEEHRVMIASMGALYWQGLTVSEVIFRSNDEYLERGWVMQEILNGTVLIKVAEVRSPGPRVLRVMQNANTCAVGWVLTVALNNGADVARAIPAPPEGYYASLNGQLSNEDVDATITYVASLRGVTLDDRTESVTVTESVFLYSIFMHAGPDAPVLIPVGSSLKLAWQRGAINQSGFFTKEAVEISRFRGAAGEVKEGIGVLKQKRLGELQDLSEYNTRNLLAKFTHEGDRHFAIYGLLEQARGRRVTEEEKREYRAAPGKAVCEKGGWLEVVNGACSALDLLVSWRRQDGECNAQADARERLGAREAAVYRSSYYGAVALGAGVGLGASEWVVAIAGDGPRAINTFTGLDGRATLARAGVSESDMAAILSCYPPERVRADAIGIVDVESGEQWALTDAGERARRETARERLSR